ncbi:hypothetical protein BDN72DRAFT_901348 [Pluteus cervinus]|uniref:Uncharacterized protein n=1 Tax=Pluteus cervinus TaxID=181527 RepID=A0ACD3AGQ5_9AGAR|nr:hypothetical protein BDN72DRAFT_901348 [Pluteus cervinus]
MSSRTVLIDDTSSLITYSASWSVEQGDTLGGFDNTNGAPFRGTLHSTSGTGYFTLSFRFNGSSVSAIGASSFKNSNSGATYSCFVDQQPLQTHAPSTSLDLTTAWPICAISVVASGSHELAINFTTNTGIAPFYLDYVSYSPPAGASDDRVDTMQVDNTDPAFHFSDGWLDYQDFTNITLVSGSKVSFDFNGESVTWYGHVAQEFPAAQSSASYSIDGGAPTAFQFQGSLVDLNNVVFFTTPTLPLGQHTLEVVHDGSTTSAPLSLDYVYVQNALVSYPPSSSTAPESIPSSGPTSKGLPLPAILGAAIGGALILLLCLVLLLWRHRRGRRERAARQSIFTVSEEGHHPAPVDILRINKRDEGPPVSPSTNPTFSYVETNSTLKSKSSSQLNPLNVDARPTTSTSVTSTTLAEYSGSPSTPSAVARPLSFNEADSTHPHLRSYSQPHIHSQSRSQIMSSSAPRAMVQVPERRLRVANGDPILEGSTDSAGHEDGGRDDGDLDEPLSSQPPRDMEKPPAYTPTK